MKEIALTQGMVAFVDDEDYEMLSKWKWHAHKQQGRFYASHRISNQHVDGSFSMHRMLLHPPKGMMVDHIDGNPLNNQKSNLRVVTNRQNQQNRHAHRSSKYPGVSYRKKDAVWVSHIKIPLFGGKKKYLGSFKSELEAFTAYCVAEKIFVGDGVCGVRKG